MRMGRPAKGIYPGFMRGGRGSECISGQIMKLSTEERVGASGAAELKRESS